MGETMKEKLGFYFSWVLNPFVMAMVGGSFISWIMGWENWWDILPLFFILIPLYYITKTFDGDPL